MQPSYYYFYILQNMPITEGAYCLMVFHHTLFWDSVTPQKFHSHCVGVCWWWETEMCP